MAYCSKGHELRKCYNCGFVSCIHCQSESRNYSGDTTCLNCGTYNGMVSYSDSSTPSSSSSWDGIALGLILLAALICAAIKFWWITLSVIGVAGGIVWAIARYRSNKKAKAWEDSDERKELAESLKQQDERRRPNESFDKGAVKLKEFRYKWSLKGQEIIGTYRCRSEEELRRHVIDVGGNLIEILGGENKEGLPKTCYNESNAYTPKTAKLNTDDSCDELNNDSFDTVQIQEAFENYINVRAIDLGAQNPDKLDTWDIGRLVTHPEVLPCAYDLTVGRWLYRLKFWGKPDIIWFHPTTGEKEKMTESQLNCYLSGIEFLQNFGKWYLHKVSFKSFEMSRRWKGADGKMISEKITVDIDLNDNVKQALKMKLA